MSRYRSTSHAWGPFVLRSWWFRLQPQTLVRVFKDHWWEYKGRLRQARTLWIGVGHFAVALSYLRRAQ